MTRTLAATHLATRPLLTEAQVARYQALRGEPAPHPAHLPAHR